MLERVREEMRPREIEVFAPDGRRLFGRLAGPSEGDVVVFHTGTPGTRYLYEGYLGVGERLGFRHLCISRPGYGGSDRQPGRRIAACAADVALFADELSLDSFYVVGHSGGGGHALACAALLPDRVRSAAVLSALAPRSADGLDWEADFCKANIEEFGAVEKGDAELRRLLAEMIFEMGKVETVGQLRAQIEVDDDMFSDADRAVLVGALLDHEFWCRVQIGSEGTDGWFDDDKALGGSWGFDLSTIDVPTVVWQGEEDKIVPLAHGEWLACAVPNARFKPLSGEGHISYFEQRYGDILEELVAIAR
jgi:pimeloyl-ACP methyl ester carboxylesterase